MAIATDTQVQQYVNDRIRPHSEAIRNLYLKLKDDKAVIADVYSAVTQQSPTWSDTRTDGPPHLLTPSDVLAYNTFITAFIAMIEGVGDPTAAAAQYPVIQNACVQSPGS